MGFLIKEFILLLQHEIELAAKIYMCCASYCFITLDAAEQTFVHLPWILCLITSVGYSLCLSGVCVLGWCWNSCNMTLYHAVPGLLPGRIRYIRLFSTSIKVLNKTLWPSLFEPPTNRKNIWSRYFYSYLLFLKFYKWSKKLLGRILENKSEIKSHSVATNFPFRWWNRWENCLALLWSPCNKLIVTWYAIGKC